MFSIRMTRVHNFDTHYSVVVRQLRKLTQIIIIISGDLDLTYSKCFMYLTWQIVCIGV